MSKAELASQLSTLFFSLLKASRILLGMYGPWLRAIVAIFIASLAFRLGRQSIIDRVEQDVRKIQNVLKNRSMYSLSMPKQLERLSSIKKAVMAANLILLSAVSVKAIKIKIALLKSLHLTFLLQVFIVALFALLFIWGYQLYLTSAIEKGRKISMLINEELYSLMQLVGSRGESIVRAHLCKEKYAKRQKHPVGVCFKEDCREARKYLKIKADLMQSVVMTGLTFQWCSVCSNRPQFEQYLHFQSSAYCPPAGEECEVQSKNAYLLLQCQRIRDWIQSVSPCNCSKLYWLAELKEIKQFKSQQKEVEAEYLMVQNRKMIRGMR